LDFVVTKQLKYFELADLNNVVTQEDLSTILSIDYNQVPNIDKVKLNLFLTFSKINHYNFLDLSNLVELNIGPLDKISFYTLISYLKYTHITTLTIRLNKSNDFDHNDFKFLMEEKSILKVLEIYHIDFGDTNNYDRILEYLLFNNSIRHFVISSYYESFGISIQHEVIYNNNYYYLDNDLNLFYTLLNIMSNKNIVINSNTISDINNISNVSTIRNNYDNDLLNKCNNNNSKNSNNIISNNSNCLNKIYKIKSIVKKIFLFLQKKVPKKVVIINNNMEKYIN